MNEAERKREYKKQQTIEEQAAIEVKRRMLKQIEQIVGEPRQIGVVQRGQVTNVYTGKTTEYYVIVE